MQFLVPANVLLQLIEFTKHLQAPATPEYLGVSSVTLRVSSQMDLE